MAVRTLPMWMLPVGLGANRTTVRGSFNVLAIALHAPRALSDHTRSQCAIEWSDENALRLLGLEQLHPICEPHPRFRQIGCCSSWERNLRQTGVGRKSWFTAAAMDCASSIDAVIVRKCGPASAVSNANSTIRLARNTSMSAMAPTRKKNPGGDQKTLLPAPIDDGDEEERADHPIEAEVEELALDFPLRKIDDAHWTSNRPRQERRRRDDVAAPLPSPP